MFNLFLLMCLSAIVGSNLADYCSVCSDHTMCKFQEIGPTCGGDSDSGVSKSEAQEIVNIHNAYRSKVANGEESRGSPGPQPSAANMNAFIWDDQLAEVAQKWADQCTFQHDKCRNDPRFKVGQNIYWSSGLSNVDWKRAISAWYEEVTEFSGETADSFQFSEKIGHYSQMIWGNTRYIGCGRTTYGGSYRLEGYTPREFILSTLTEESNSTESQSSNNVKLAREANPLGFFGGASFDPTGARGSLGTDFTESTTENSESNRRIVRQAYLGFFGGAKFDPNGARGSLGVKSPGNSRPKPQPGRRPGFNRPVYGYDNGMTRPQHGYGNNRPTYGSPSFTWGVSNSPYRPFTTWIYRLRALTSSINTHLVGDNMNHSEPVQNPVQYQLPSYEERLQTIADHSSQEDKITDTKPQIIRTHKWSPDEWLPIEYKFTGRDQILICNYGPAGNYKNQPLYIPGEPCSLCPAGTSCKNGLCT